MISVLTPVWNRLDITQNYIKQIRGQLRDGIELILCDDGSTDGTAAFLKTLELPNLQIITNEENLGFGESNNRMARVAHGENLLLLNNDVKILGDLVYQVNQQLDLRPNSIVGPLVVDWSAGWNAFKDCVIPYVPGWCLGIRKSLWDKLDGFDVKNFEKYDYEDMDLCYRAQRDFEASFYAQSFPVSHHSSATTGTLPDRRKTTELHRDRFAKKHNLIVA